MAATESGSAVELALRKLLKTRSVSYKELGSDPLYKNGGDLPLFALCHILIVIETLLSRSSSAFLTWQLFMKRPRQYT